MEKYTEPFSPVYQDNIFFFFWFYVIAVVICYWVLLGVFCFVSVSKELF